VTGKPGEMAILPSEADIIRRIFAEYSVVALHVR
jgi:hypothetical protein